MTSIHMEELVCPRPPCFKPLKFLGPTCQDDERFVFHLDANTSFKENDDRRRINSSKSKRKAPKCSLLKFLQTKAQKKSRQVLRLDN